jgi:head-tail adaptor
VAVSALVARAAARMRQVIERHMLTDQCALQSVVDTPDGHGGYTQTWVPAGTVPCMIASPPSSGEGQGGIIEVLSAQPGKTILVSIGTTVRPAWRITPASLARTYEVTHVEPPGTHEALISCQCVEL